jgi:hypothetical protein
LQWACQGPKGLNKDKVLDNNNKFNKGGRIFFEFRQRPNALVKVLTAGGKTKRTLFRLTEKRLGLFIFQHGRIPDWIVCRQKGRINGKGRKRVVEGGRNAFSPPPQEMKISTI